MKNFSQFRIDAVFVEPRKLKDLKAFDIGYPSRFIDAQEIEESKLFDPDFELILSHLDRTLDQIPEQEYELKRYIIEATLTDTSDDFEPESLEIIRQGMIKFGPVSQLLVQNV